MRRPPTLPTVDDFGIVAIDTSCQRVDCCRSDGEIHWVKWKDRLRSRCSTWRITEHAEKYAAFENTLRSFYPNLRMLKPIERSPMRSRKRTANAASCLKKIRTCLGSTSPPRSSIPVLKAARDATLLDLLTVITTDLFPDLVFVISVGQAVAASIYLRPRAQGPDCDSACCTNFWWRAPADRIEVALAPHLVMRGNLDFFLHRQTPGISHRKRRAAGPGIQPRTGGDFA